MHVMGLGQTWPGLSGSTSYLYSQVLRATEYYYDELLSTTVLLSTTGAGIRVLNTSGLQTGGSSRVEVYLSRKVVFLINKKNYRDDVTLCSCMLA